MKVLSTFIFTQTCIRKFCNFSYLCSAETYILNYLFHTIFCADFLIGIKLKNHCKIIYMEKIERKEIVTRPMAKKKQTISKLKKKKKVAPKTIKTLSRDMSKLKLNPAAIQPNKVTNSGNLLGEMYKAGALWSRCLVDPQSVSCRVPDSICEPTALYRSTITIPIYADVPLDGSFVAIMQGILGESGGKTNLFQNAIYHSTPTNTGNFALASNFDPKYTSDTNTQYLVNSLPSQNSWNANFDVSTVDDITVTSPLTPFFTSGYNNDGYSYVEAGGVSVLNGSTVGVGGEFICPSGPVYHTFWTQYTTAGPGVTQNFTNASLTKQESHGHDYGYKITLHKYNSLLNTSIVAADYTVTFNSSTTSNGSFNVVADLNQNLEYIAGTLIFHTGPSASNDNLYAGNGWIRFYSNFQNTSTDTYWLSFTLTMPKCDSGVMGVFSMDSLSTVIDNPHYGTDGLVGKIRLSAMSALFTCTLSDLNNGGEIAAALLYGEDQNKVFSPNGKEFCSVESLSSLNLKDRVRRGKLKDGAYVYWVPDQILDIQMLSNNENNAANRPFIVISGIVSNSIVGPQQIGLLTINRVFEYTTVSTLVDAEQCVGTDMVYQCVTGALAKQPKVSENDEHRKLIPKLVHSAASTFGSLIGLPSNLVSSLVGLVI